MLLALDVGNTQTVVGIFDDEDHQLTRAARSPGELPGLRYSWRLATVPERTADEHVMVLKELLDLVGMSLPGLGESIDADEVIDGLAISSSVPVVTGAIREMVDRWLDIPIVTVEPGVKTGIPVLYDNPKEVGADRIVNAVGAVDLYDGPTIVVDLGTATTFDAISSAGEYLGGAIVPGLEISMDALSAQAAALRSVGRVAPKRAIGRSTVESMQVGAIFGHAALVDGLCRRIMEELGPSTVVATGGLGSLISPHAELIEFYEPWLTLHGLRLVYARNTLDVDQEMGQ